MRAGVVRVATASTRLQVVAQQLRLALERVDPLVVTRSTSEPGSATPYQHGWWQVTSEVEVPGDEDLDLVLGPLGSIRGRVLGPAGHPVESFHIRVSPSPKAGAPADLRHACGWTYDGTTDVSFVLTGLFDGILDVSVEEESSASHARSGSRCRATYASCSSSCARSICAAR